MLRQSFLSLLVVMGATGCTFSQDLGQHGSGGKGGAGGAGAVGAGGNATGGSSGSGTGGSAGAAGGTGGSGGSTGGSSTGGAGGGASCPTVVVGTDKTIAATNPRGIAVDATNVYWTTEQVPGVIGRANKRQPVGETFASSAIYPSQPKAFAEASAIRVSGGRVYWASRGGIDLWSLPTGGGTLENLYDDATAVDSMNISWPETLAIYAGYAYWNKRVLSDEMDPTGMRNYIMKTPLAGGAAQALAYFDADTNYVTALSMNPSISVDASGAYFTLSNTSQSRATLKRVTLDGATVSDVAQLGEHIVADGAYIYDGQDGWVFGINKTSGAAQPLFSPPGPNNGDQTQGIFEYGGNLYVTSSGYYLDGTKVTPTICGWVRKVPLNGGAATVLWAGVGQPYTIAADANGVYWTDINQNTVHVLRP